MEFPRGEVRSGAVVTDEVGICLRMWASPPSADESRAAVHVARIEAKAGSAGTWAMASFSTRMRQAKRALRYLRGYFDFDRNGNKIVRRTDFTNCGGRCCCSTASCPAAHVRDPRAPPAARPVLRVEHQPRRLAPGLQHQRHRRARRVRARQGRAPVPALPQHGPALDRRALQGRTHRRVLREAPGRRLAGEEPRHAGQPAQRLAVGLPGHRGVWPRVAQHLAADAHVALHSPAEDWRLPAPRAHDVHLLQDGSRQPLPQLLSSRTRTTRRTCTTSRWPTWRTATSSPAARCTTWCGASSSPASASRCPPSRARGA